MIRMAWPRFSCARLSTHSHTQGAPISNNVFLVRGCPLIPIHREHLYPRPKLLLLWLYTIVFTCHLLSAHTRRKRALQQYLHSSRQQLLRLVALVGWTPKAKALAECVDHDKVREMRSEALGQLN